MKNIQITIIDKWPKLRMIITEEGGATTPVDSPYDTAYANFECAMQNALRRTVVAQIKESQPRS